MDVGDSVLVVKFSLEMASIGRAGQQRRHGREREGRSSSPGEVLNEASPSELDDDSCRLWLI